MELDQTPNAPKPSDQATEYDRSMWRKKLQGMLEHLPGSAGTWSVLVSEAAALGFDPAWVHDCIRTEYELLIHKVVSDRKVREAERERLEQARALLEIPESEAAALLSQVIAEAESFFDKEVEQG